MQTILASWLRGQFLKSDGLDLDSGSTIRWIIYCLPEAHFPHLCYRMQLLPTCTKVSILINELIYVKSIDRTVLGLEKAISKDCSYSLIVDLQITL